MAVGGGLAARFVSLGGIERRLIAFVDQFAETPPRSDATVVYDVFASRFMGRVEFGIALPPGVRVGTRLPVCFCLPGRGGSARSVFGMHMPDFVAQGIERRHVRPFALAAVGGGDLYWHRRASGEDPMTMLLEEFVPLCERRYRLGGGHGARRGIMGWSMGGYGAILAAERAPKIFCALSAASPALWPSYEAMKQGPGDAFDSAADFAANDVFALAPKLMRTAVRIDCGTSDPFYQTDKAFFEHLTETLPHKPSGGFTHGAHESGYWRRIAAQQVDFLGRALAHR